MSSLLKNLLIALAIALALWLGYSLLMRNSTGNVSSTNVDNVTGSAQIESEKLLSTIQKLKSYTVESSLFTDSRFVSLKDFRVPLVDEPSGRLNPFAPVQ